MTPRYRPTQPNPRRDPAKAAAPKLNVVWTQTLEPPDLYAIRYDRDVDERTVELRKVGHDHGVRYYQILHAGIIKTPRADRVRTVRQLTFNHPQLIRVQPTYSDVLPPWPGEPLSVRVPQLRGDRTWGVELGGLYWCACPEKRRRSALGYDLPQLGGVCPHLARALLENLPVDPAQAPGWTEDLRDFLSNPTLINVENLL